jgi:hypothetical protein
LPGRSLYGATTQRSGEVADDADDADATASLDDDDDDDDRGGATARDGSSNDDARGVRADGADGAEGERVDVVFSGTRRGAGRRSRTPPRQRDASADARRRTPSARAAFAAEGIASEGDDGARARCGVRARRVRRRGRLVEVQSGRRL